MVVALLIFVNFYLSYFRINKTRKNTFFRYLNEGKNGLKARFPDLQKTEKMHVVPTF